MNFIVACRDMRTPPSGSTSTIPSDLTGILTQFSDEQKLVIKTLASIAKEKRRWMGVCLRDVYVATELEKTLTKAEMIELSLFHVNFDPTGWFVASLHARRTVAVAFASASTEKPPLTNIINGHAYPTQRLADIVCA